MAGNAVRRTLGSGLARAWLLAPLLFCSMPYPAAAVSFDRGDLDVFVERMVSQHHFDEGSLRRLLAAAEPSADVIARITRPAEGKPWHQYRQIFLTPERIRAGVAFWAGNAATLDRAQTRFGVAPEIIVAIIGVETFYGRLTGGHRAIDALATLAFDYPRRASYFTGELEAFLLLTRDQALDPLQLTGSYAGALGMPQFMPSSYRAYAVDFDGDGHADIWQSPADAIGSVGNYLGQHGWQRDGAITVPAIVQGEAYRDLLDPDLVPNVPAARLAGHGVRAATPIPDNVEVELVELEAAPDATELWIGFQNFYVITRYNKSPLYAMAVFQLAAAIRAERERSSTAAR